MIHPNVLETESTGSALPELTGIQGFESFLRNNGRFQPGWLLERRRQAWDRFQALPFPNRRDENWRFATVERNLLANLFPARQADPEFAEEAVARSNLLDQPAGRLIFADGSLVRHDALDPSLTDQGVIFAPLADAIQAHPELLKSHFLKATTELGGEKFAALHAAFVTSGALIYVPKGVEIKDPIVIYHWLGSDRAAVFPHTLVIAEDNSLVNVMDAWFSRDGETTGFSSAVGNLYAGRGARVIRKTVQDWNEESVSFQFDTTIAGQDAFVQNLSVNLGGRRARSENRVKIEGRGAEVKMYSLTVAESSQEFDQRTLQIHAAPNAVSDLLYKNALMDHSRTIFSGLIKVEENAQQTDAYQTNRNLLLDPTAEANSLPGLEIGANDVKCSHGATTGRLSPGELFYLRSRGLPEREAKRLMVFGFFEEIIEKLDHEQLAENVRGLVQAKFLRSQRA